MCLSHLQLYSFAGFFPEGELVTNIRINPEAKICNKKEIIE